MADRAPGAGPAEMEVLLGYCRAIDEAAARLNVVAVRSLVRALATTVKTTDALSAGAAAPRAGERDGRDSLAQEIRETLAVRGLWAPKNPADLISAIGKALDDLRGGGDMSSLADKGEA